MTCTDCGGCSTSKRADTGACPCDGWAPDASGACLPECNKWHLGPAGVARYDFNADGACVFFNEDGTPRPKPAASDLCDGPGGVSVRGGSMCVNTTVAAALTCPPGRVRTEGAPEGCVYFDEAAKAQAWHDAAHAACKAAAAPRQCTCDVIAGDNVTVFQHHGALRGCSDVGICSSDAALAPAAACSSACAIAADGLTLEAPGDFFTHTMPPYTMDEDEARGGVSSAYGAFTISPIVIHTVSVYSILRGSLGTCISNVEYGCVKNDPTKGAFPAAHAVLPFCRDARCEAACRQWPRPSWFAGACESGPSPACKSGEASASTSFYFRDGTLVPPIDTPVKRYAWEVAAADDDGFTRLYSELSESETKQAASYYDAMCLYNDINGAAEICVGVNTTGCFVPDVPLSRWHSVRDACILAITLTARAATFRAPASPQDVTNDTFLQAYNIMNTARDKYDHRIKQRIFLIYDWRFGPSKIIGGVTKYEPCLQSWYYLDGPSYGAPGQYQDHFKYCMCDTKACAPPNGLSPPPSPPPFPPPPRPPPTPPPPPPCDVLGTCAPPTPAPRRPSPLLKPRPPPPPLMSPPPVNVLSATLELVSLDKDSALAFTQADGDALATKLGEALAGEVGVAAPTDSSVVLTYPVADVIQFVGMREDLFMSADAEAVRAAVAFTNSLPVGNVDILRVTSSLVTANGVIVDHHHGHQSLLGGVGDGARRRRRGLRQIVSGVGFADPRLSPPPAMPAPTVYIAVRAGFASAAAASCGVRRRLILDVSTLNVSGEDLHDSWSWSCTLGGRDSADSFTDSLQVWNTASTSTLLSKATFMADDDVAATRNFGLFGAVFHPAGVTPQLSVKVRFGMTTNSEEDATKMGDALAALQSPSSTSSAKTILAAAGMTVAGLQYSSYSGDPSIYFVAPPPRDASSTPPTPSPQILSAPGAGTTSSKYEEVSSENRAIAIGAFAGGFVLALAGLAYYYTHKKESALYKHDDDDDDHHAPPQMNNKVEQTVHNAPAAAVEQEEESAASERAGPSTLSLRERHRAFEDSSSDDVAKHESAESGLVYGNKALARALARAPT